MHPSNSKAKKYLSAVFILITLFNLLSAQKALLWPKQFEINNLKPVETIIQAANQFSLLKIRSFAKSTAIASAHPQKADDIAYHYLAEIAQEIGIRNIAEDIQLKKILTSPAGQHFVYQGIYLRVPVYGSTIVTTLNEQNKVSFLASNYRRDLQVKIMQPVINAQQAIAAARQFLLAGNKFHAQIKSKLMIFDSKSRDARLAYRVELPAADPLGDWEVFVDAADAQVLHVRNMMMHDHSANGRGMIWDPDPLISAGVYYGGLYVDNNDQNSTVLNSQRQSVVLRDITYLDTEGVYILEGPYARLADRDIIGPADQFPALQDSSAFNFSRNQQQFEHVMVYYHIDKSYRRLAELGFDIPGLYAFQADPHGFGGEDNSYYSILGNFCAFGEGGVDDAEDAGIIWHEYGHAIQHNIVNMSYTGETFSLQEGSSDYWAASYKRRQSDFGWQFIYFWDAGILSAEGDYYFWPGRRCDRNWRYPEDYIPFAGVHEGGQIWSSALMHIWGELGADLTDELFLLTHYYWGQNPGMRDAALAFIQADIDRYDGLHLPVITYWFDYHGLIDINNFRPRIVHSPLKDTEDLIGPYQIECQILPANVPLDPEKLNLIWGYDQSPSDTISLYANDSLTGYIAEIPGRASVALVNYYLSAEDSVGQGVMLPDGAPQSYYSFYAGPDTIAPQIDITPLFDQPLSLWPARVSAEITDNLGIDSVWVQYQISGSDSLFEFPLNPYGQNSTYTGYFYADSGQISPMDTIFYRIIAEDSSSDHNRATFPDEGFLHFVLYLKPPPPEQLAILSNEDNIILGWNQIPAGENIYFRIFRCEEDNEFILLDSTVQTTYLDTFVILDRTYGYYLRTVDPPWQGDPSDTVQATVVAVVSVDRANMMPEQFKLCQNYPNPFNPQTNIRYAVPIQTNVRIEIYNLLGQRMIMLTDALHQPGYYNLIWNGTTESGSPAASGIYFYRIITDDFVQMRKMILIR